MVYDLLCSLPGIKFNDAEYKTSYSKVRLTVIEVEIHGHIFSQ